MMQQQVQQTRLGVSQAMMTESREQHHLAVVSFKA